MSPSVTPEPEVSQLSPVSQRYGARPITYEAPEEKPFYENFADPIGTVEQNVLTTLENLEAGLLSQGFVPLEPNTLQTIAKTQEPVSPAVPLTPDVAISQEEGYHHDALPSLLSELGSFVQEPVNASSIAGSSFVSAQMTPDVAFEEPAWLAALNAVPAPSSLAERQREMQTRQEGQIYSSLPPVQSSWAGIYTPHGTPPLSSVQGENILDNSLSLAAQLPTNSTRQGTEAPLVRQSSPHDYLLNNELETTMKRPAVRLQPMEQAHSFTQNERVSLPSRSRMAEQSYAGRSAENNLSHQERLLKGYQHQLVGDYDEAMQEYRIIIRNSPELLGEVVSNVRALLKLAPKYSTGYRVLGDAYMRQGEYLQAMEAYNKALTMAKRAKS
jgi:tetratricopeptide (TPR) repeat protein